jgi:hypothetical protein
MSKLVLDIEDDYFEFDVIAIRSASKLHRLAFAVNEQWEGVFQQVYSWEHTHRGQQRVTPRCRAIHPTLDSEYFLIENKYYYQSGAGEGLFQQVSGAQWASQKLIPQMRSVDYFMLIFDGASAAELNKLTRQLKAVREVESAWSVDLSSAKGVEALLDFNYNEKYEQS